MRDLTLDRAAASERDALVLFGQWYRSAGGVKRQAICIIGASVSAASGRLNLLERILNRAHAAGLSRLALEEALLQVYLFAGYPRAIEALACLARIWPPGERPAPAARNLWRRRGTDLCRVVYGNRYERMREAIRTAHPDLADWMIEEGYGKVLSRPGLEPPMRELCAVAALAVLSAPRQLRAHVRGALNTGASANEVAGAVRLAALGCGLVPWRTARNIARDELSRNGASRA